MPERKIQLMAQFASLLLAIWLLPFTAAAQADKQALVTIGSGSVGGVYYPTAGALCRLLNRERVRHGLRCVIEVSNGSVQNVRDVIEHRIDFGLVQTDIQADAIIGRRRFEKDGPRDNLRALFTVHAEPFTVVTRLGANIRKFSDLKGKRINLGKPGSGTSATMAMLMNSFGLTREMFSQVFDLPASQAGAALCENKIDAFVYVVGHPNRALRTVSETCAIRVVPVTGKPVDELLGEREYFARTTVPARIYVGNNEPVETVGVRASVLTLDSMPEKIAYELTRAIFAHLNDVRGLHPAFANLRAPEMLTGNLAPYHPGAARYFKEAGIRIQ